MNEVILAVDSGTHEAGLAIMEMRKDKPLLIDARQQRLKGSTLQRRLVSLEIALAGMIELYHPVAIALEDGFAGGFATATIGTAMGRAIVLLVAEHNGLKVFKYTPKEIKQTVAKGGASKKQVQDAVRMLTGQQLAEDAADAVAIGYTYWSKGGMAIAN